MPTKRGTHPRLSLEELEALAQADLKELAEEAVDFIRHRGRPTEEAAFKRLVSANGRWCHSEGAAENERQRRRDRQS